MDRSEHARGLAQQIRALITQRTQAQDPAIRQALEVQIAFLRARLAALS